MTLTEVLLVAFDASEEAALRSLAVGAVFDEHPLRVVRSLAELRAVEPELMTGIDVAIVAGGDDEALAIGVINALAERGDPRPVIAIGGGAKRDAMRRFLRAGGASYLAREGLTGNVLSMAVDVALERRRLRELTPSRVSDVLEYRRQLRSLVDYLPAMAAYWDDTLHNKFANRAFVDWFGSTPEAIRGRHVREVLGDELFAKNLPYLEAALRGAVQRFEREIVTPTGTRYVDASYVPDICEGRVRGLFVLVFDITERRRIELALQASEARFRSMAESSPFGVFTADTNSKPTYRNARCIQIVGNESSTGMATVAPRARERVGLAWAQMVATAGRCDTVCPFEHADGKTVWARVVGVPIREGDEVTGYIATVEDVTAHRGRDAYLGVLRDLLQRTSEFVLIRDRRGELFFINDAVRAALELPPDVAVNELRARDLLTRMFCDDASIATLESLTEAALGDGIAAGEASLHTARGRLDVSLQVTVHTDDDERWGFVAIVARDISSLKEEVREQSGQLRALGTTLADAMITTDEHGVILDVNPAAERMFGLHESSLVGSNVSSLMNPSNASQHDGPMKQFKERGPSVALGSIRQVQAQRADGHTFPAELTVSVSTLGRRPIFRGILRDISERVRIERELRVAVAAAQSANEAKSVFLMNMSHEIRTPMNAILGMGELLEGSPLTPTQHRYLRSMREAGHHLLQVINDVLDVARIEVGKLELDNAPLALRALVEGICAMLAGRAEERGLALRAELDATFRPTVLGDETRLRQVLINLIGNAIKFTTQGEVVVRVAREGGLPDGYRFSVSDTGAGIPADRREAIFEVFGQADSSITRRYGGTGLGLTIAAGLVKKMGGRLGVESELGRGSTFSFTIQLPADPSAVADNDDGRDSLSGMTVMVVGASAAESAVVRAALEEAGAVVSAASTRDEALTRLRRAKNGRHPFGLVVVRSPLPGADTAALVTSIRAEALVDGGEAVVVLLDPRSGAIDASITEPYASFGRATVVAEPLSTAVLLKAIRSALGFTGASSEERGSGSASTPLQRGPQEREELRILVAEDMPINRELIATFVQSMPWRLTFAEDGRSAVEQSAAGTFDLILMDIQMPELDGFEATRRIRDRERANHLPRTPIVALTAHALKTEVERCLQAGCDGHLAKPMSRAGLVAAIQTYAKRRSA